MKSKVVYSVVALLILLTGTLFLITNSDNEEVVENNTTVNSSALVEENNSEETSEQQPIETASSQGKYVDYTEQSLQESADTKRVVFFHAPWCSTCNFYEGQIEDQGVPSGVTILKVDYDSETELKELYGVNIQSTFVLLDENGEVKNSWPFARGLSGIQDLYEQV